MKKQSLFKTSSQAIVLSVALLFSSSQAFATEGKTPCPSADAGAEVVSAAGAGVGGVVGFKASAFACGAASLITLGLATPLCPLIIAAGTLGGGVIGASASASKGYEVGALFDEDDGCRK